MVLEGSCHCKAVRFSVEANHPYPFSRCYCSICRKTAGGGGYAINLGGRFSSLRFEGEEHIRVYRARVGDDGDGGLGYGAVVCLSIVCFPALFAAVFIGLRSILPQPFPTSGHRISK